VALELAVATYLRCAVVVVGCTTAIFLVIRANLDRANIVDLN